MAIRDFYDDYVGRMVAVGINDRHHAIVGWPRDRLATFRNIRFAAGDVLEIEIDGVFDVVVLPDVIEHIPIDSHPRLFRRIATWLAPGGFVLLNYPNPLFLQWLHENKPEALQVIDQPVHADGLLASSYAAGLYLDFLQTYSIWTREGDYIVAVMKSLAAPRAFTNERKNSLLKRVRGRFVRLLWRDAVPPLDMGRHPRSVPTQSAARRTHP